MAFGMRSPKCGLISLTLPLKRKLLKQKRLRPRLLKHQRLKPMKSQRLSRETLGAQFIVRLMHGKGGPVAFAMRSPKRWLDLINLRLKRKPFKTETCKTETLKTETRTTHEISAS